MIPDFIPIVFVLFALYARLVRIHDTQREILKQLRKDPNAPNL